MPSTATTNQTLFILEEENKTKVKISQKWKAILIV